MSAESTLYSLLDTHAGLAGLVAERIYPGALPEGCDYPAVVFARTDTQGIDTLHGTRLAEDVTLSVQGWGLTRTQANAVGDQIQAALKASGNLPTNRADVADDATGLDGVEITVTLLINL